MWWWYIVGVQTAYSLVLGCVQTVVPGCRSEVTRGKAWKADTVKEMKLHARLEDNDKTTLVVNVGRFPLLTIMGVTGVAVCWYCLVYR